MSILKDLWMTNGDVYDPQVDLMYGERYGFKFAVKAHAQNQFSLLLSVKNDAPAVDTLHGKAIAQTTKAVTGTSFKQYKLTCTIRPGMTKKKTKANILEAIEDVTAYLSTNGFVPCCEVTGDTKDVSLYIVGNQLSFLSPEAFSQKSQELDANQQVTLETKENMLLGGLGAFLGSLIGVAAIVILGQLGYVSLLSGVVMGICAIKDYELLAKRLSVKGAILSALIILVMTYFANQLDWTITAARAYEVSIFDTFPYIHDLVAEGYIDESVYNTNLVLIFLTTILSAAYMIWSALKDHKTKFDIRKLY